MQSVYRGWQSQGTRESKAITPAQLVHLAGLSYTLTSSSARVTGSFEVHNFTNQRVYDFFGSERPGRSYYFKLTGTL